MGTQDATFKASVFGGLTVAEARALILFKYPVLAEVEHSSANTMESISISSSDVNDNAQMVEATLRSVVRWDSVRNSENKILNEGLIDATGLFSLS